MSDNVELHAKVLGFLVTELARKEARQCISVDLLYAPGNGFRDEELRSWQREDEPELFGAVDGIENLVRTILGIAEGETDSKNSGKHRFVVRANQYAGGRAVVSFAILAKYHGDFEAPAAKPEVPAPAAKPAKPAPPGSPEQLATEVICALLLELRQENAALRNDITELRVEIAARKADRHCQQFDDASRVLGAQNEALQRDNEALRAELVAMRGDRDARSIPTP